VPRFLGGADHNMDVGTGGHAEAGFDVGQQL